jgi:hypothetical protein
MHGAAQVAFFSFELSGLDLLLHKRRIWPHLRCPCTVVPCRLLSSTFVGLQCSIHITYASDPRRQGGLAV